MNNDIICFDLETTGRDPELHDIVEIAAQAYSGRSLTPYADGQFYSLMRPVHPENIDPEAMLVHGIPREKIDAAPLQKVVWNRFVTWVKSFNKDNSIFGAPVAAGKNIRRFDMPFVTEACRRHCQAREETLLFSPMRLLDLDEMLFYWFEDDPDVTSYSMDALRDYFKLSKEGDHTAMVDNDQTGRILVALLRLHRKLRRVRVKDGRLLLNMKTILEEDVP